MRFLLVAMLVLCSLGARSAHAISTLDVDPSCAEGRSISVRLFFLDDPWNPSPLPPEWIGYDLFRQPADFCPSGNAPVRVNPEIIVRPPAGVHELTYVDTPPDPAGTYRYSARFVDAARNPVEVPSCWDCRFGAADYASCPPNTVPVSVGRIVDWDRTLYLEPCAETCFSGGTLDGEPWEKELAPYAGTNTVFNIYGSIGCCSVGTDAHSATPNHLLLVGRLKACVSTIRSLNRLMAHAIKWVRSRSLFVPSGAVAQP